MPQEPRRLSGPAVIAGPGSVKPGGRDADPPFKDPLMRTTAEEGFSVSPGADPALAVPEGY